MIQEEKELLLRDLSARLPYIVKGIITYNKSNTIFTVEGIDNNVLHLSDAEECYVEDFKPYLRPISSMTEKEKEEFEQIRYNAEAKLFNAFSKGGFTLAFHEIDDWLNSKHFDYRGLISMELALEAPKGMYVL